MDEQKLKQFEPIFYPKSIALVGVSNNMHKFGSRYLRALLSRGFKGKLYAINPNESDVQGVPTYPDLRSVPEPVDYVSVYVPRHLVLTILDDCAANGVKAVQFFTAGFSETGEEEGVRLEEEMVKKARRGGFRIIGPNCTGVYSPKVNIPCGAEDVFGEAGSVAFLAQSGSLSGRAIQRGIACGLRFSKALNYGNGCDLDSIESLEYFAVDPETEVVSAYLEGIKDGRRLLQVVKEISERKPIVIWKGGKSEVGAKAAFSHTGALASPASTWEAALKQVGAIEVNNLEELIDTLLAFQQLSSVEGRGITIVSGLVDGGGGQTVSAADTCISLGLNLPPFSDETKSQLRSLLGEVGSILHNPLDVSQSYSNTEVIHQAIEIAGADQNINVIIIQENVDLLVTVSPESIEPMSDALIDLRKKGKSIVMVLEHGLAEAERLSISRKLLAAKIPVFPSLERAAKAIANMNRYSDYRRAILAESY